MVLALCTQFCFEAAGRASHKAQRSVKNAPSAPDTVFSVTTDLEQCVPFSAPCVSKLTGHRLVPDSYDLLCPWEMCSDGKFKNQFSWVVLKPAKTRSYRGVVWLTVNPKVVVTRADVDKRFGAWTEIKILPLAADKGHKDPVIMIYQRPWGSLRFGFSPEQPDRLKDIVLDATTGAAESALVIWAKPS